MIGQISLNSESNLFQLIEKEKMLQWQGELVDMAACAW
jgi:hypothetical protein